MSQTNEPIDNLTRDAVIRGLIVEFSDEAKGLVGNYAVNVNPGAGSGEYKHLLEELARLRIVITALQDKLPKPPTNGEELANLIKAYPTNFID